MYNFFLLNCAQKVFVFRGGFRVGKVAEDSSVGTSILISCRHVCIVKISSLEFWNMFVIKPHCKINNTGLVLCIFILHIIADSNN